MAATWSAAGVASAAAPWAQFQADHASASGAFGASVAMQGATLVVGQIEDQSPGSFVTVGPGRAYVYEFRGGSWHQEQVLTGSDALPGSRFGAAIALQGDWLLIGASGQIRVDGSSTIQGAVYVFRRGPGGWTEVQKLVAGDGEVGDLFGYAIAVQGNLAVIGAFLEDIEFTPVVIDTGAVYLFDLAGNTWTQTQRLLTVGVSSNAHFGETVAIDGSTILVGAHLAAVGDQPFAGEAFVFERNPDGSWPGLQSQNLVASDATSGDRFGQYVALQGNEMIIGARRDEDHGVNSGSAYVFRRAAPGSPWVQTQKLLASDGEPGQVFGHAVAIHDDRILVGAPAATDANRRSGDVYVFERTLPANTWVEHERITPGDGATGDGFGSALAVLGSTLAVGAMLHDHGATDAGKVYVYSPDDPDHDGVPAPYDGCPDDPDPDQLDADGDGVGDVCDPCEDHDGDGYGLPAAPGCAGAELDCDDGSASIHPGHAEVGGNGVDDDCSELTADCTDADGDGFARDGGVCGATDCADGAPGVNPAATEITGNGIDDDCNPATVDCRDGDGDGYGSPGSASCAHGELDCNDGNAAVHPGAVEIPSNGVDEDCNAATPGGCSSQLASASVGAPGTGAGADLGVYATAAFLVGRRRKRRPARRSR